MEALFRKFLASHSLPLVAMVTGTLLLLLPSVAYAGWEEYLFAPLEWIGNTLSAGFVYVVVAPIAGALASFFGFLLILSSTIFEVMLNATVIGFGATLTEYGILDGIRLVWSAFRDIANIVIIGMFVFVAISMILGNMSYGTKKFVAKILIVAVLINFSLLFTQLIVDASHIAASQFYKGIRAAAVNNSVVFQEVDQSGGEQAFDAAWNRQGGVAGAFINKMGISSFGDTYRLVTKAGTQEGWAIAVFYSLTMIALLIATSAVFLYGAYLLTARAILLIVLLATAALAFAAWLVPKYGEGKYGWDGWLTTLIQTSVFAPLLMILLWASLVILSKAQTGSVGSFLQNPTGGGASASSAIVVYLFTLGMLFLSFKIASSFSHKITGFNLATAALNIGGRWTGGAVGFAGKRTLGAGAKIMDKKYGAALGGGRLPGGLALPRSIEKAVATFGSKAITAGMNASYNPARVSAAMSEKYKDVVKRYGLDTQGKGGVAAADKRAADEAKKADDEANKRSESRMKVTESERKKMFEEAMNSRPPADRSAYSENTNILRQAYQEQKKMRTELESLRKDAAHPDAPPSVVAKKSEAERKLAEVDDNIAKARAITDQFENSIREEVEGKKDDKGKVLKPGRLQREQEWKENVETIERFGEDLASRSKFDSWRKESKKKQDIDALAKAIKPKEEEGAPTNTSAPTKKKGEDHK